MKLFSKTRHFYYVLTLALLNVLISTCKWLLVLSSTVLKIQTHPFQKILPYIDLFFLVDLMEIIAWILFGYALYKMLQVSSNLNSLRRNLSLFFGLNAFLSMISMTMNIFSDFQRNEFSFNSTHLILYMFIVFSCIGIGISLIKISKALSKISFHSITKKLFERSLYIAGICCVTILGSVFSPLVLYIASILLILLLIELKRFSDISPSAT